MVTTAHDVGDDRHDVSTRAARLLELAQRSADAVVARAREQAERILAEAEERALAREEEARETALALHVEGRRQQEELAQSIAALRETEGSAQAQARAFAQELLDLVARHEPGAATAVPAR